eukprot:12022515-Ditylum_brightwellii.AAC.1
MEHAPPAAPPFQFQFTAAAAKYNTNVLTKHKYNLCATIDSHPHSTISYGSEFRPVDVLDALL